MRLYLDLDGVTHSFHAFMGEEEATRLGHMRTCADGGRVYWHPQFFEHVPALAAALEPFPTVQVYLHSTWRHLWRESRPSDLVDWFGPLGDRFVRTVPRHLNGKRYDVIRADMADDKYTGPWIAIDDCADDFAGCPPVHFVGTDGRVGLGNAAKLAELRVKIRAQLGMRKEEINV